jgi:hypothetical protein
MYAAMMESALPVLIKITAFSAFVVVRVSGSRFDRPFAHQALSFVRQEKCLLFLFDLLSLFCFAHNLAWLWQPMPA